MSALVWDAAGTREFEAGVSEVALFVMSAAGTSYEHGVAWNGVTGITENPGGADKTDLYADDIKYASLRSAETFGCTIEAFTYPDDWAVCDGSAEAIDGVFLGQQNRRAFGLVYKTKIGSDAKPGMDAGHKLHIVYNLTAAPSSRSYATINDNPNAITFSWEADSTPVNCHNHKAVSCITIDSTKADATKLGLLEDALYGSASSTATLLSPDEVLGPSYMNATTYVPST